jgi:hypothetical protein
MNSKRLLFPVAAVLLAATIVLPLRVEKPSPSVAAASPRVVDLAAISVRPAAADAAYYRSNRIVDLPAVTVRPAAADQSLFLAGLALQASLACRC